MKSIFTAPSPCLIFLQIIIPLRTVENFLWTSRSSARCCSDILKFLIRKFGINKICSVRRLGRVQTSMLLPYRREFIAPNWNQRRKAIGFAGESCMSVFLRLWRRLRDISLGVSVGDGRASARTAAIYRGDNESAGRLVLSIIVRRARRASADSCQRKRGAQLDGHDEPRKSMEREGHYTSLTTVLGRYL